ARHRLRATPPLARRGLLVHQLWNVCLRLAHVPSSRRVGLSADPVPRSFLAFREMRGHRAPHSRHISNQLVSADPQRLELPLQLSFAILTDRTTGQLTLEPTEDVHQSSLHLIDVILEKNEGSLDVLERVSLGHHLFDCVDPPHYFDWIESLTSAV